MNIFAYIFNHKRYKQVQTLYKDVLGKYNTAYKVWAEYKKLSGRRDYRTKTIVADNFTAIKETDAWIKTYADILRNKKDALQWFYYKTGKTFVKVMRYEDYKFISDHAKEISTLFGYISTYNRMIQTKREAVDRFMVSSTKNHSYDEIEKIALGRDEISKIDTVLSKAHFCEVKYKYAWKYFANERTFKDIPLYELETVTEDTFYTKDVFLKLYEKKANLIKLVTGNNLLPIDSFSKEAIEQEQNLTQILSSCDIDPIENFHANIHLDNEKELKRAILDSIYYGAKCDFSDNFTISDFYTYRGNFDSLGISFDEACNVKEQNEAAIKAYNKETYNQSVVYISDYFDIVDKGSALKKFADKYNKEQETRDTAKRIQYNYTKGFEAIYGNVELDSCPLSVILSIIESENAIRQKNYELEIIERQRLEKERKLRVEQQRRQNIERLRSCSNTWPQPYRTTVKCFSLYYYYPTSCEWDANETEWEIRKLIWNFKANPHKQQSETLIMLSHGSACQTIIPLLKKVLDFYFGQYTNMLTLVCIPASTQKVTERRYKDFSEELCKLTGMNNAYSYVNITKDGISKNDPGNTSGHSIPVEVNLDSDFFKDKYVILFDDVITTGASVERFKNKMENAGATVIAALSVGKTKHERQNTQPIYNLI